MRIALVTGASRGIGKGIAVELAKAGYTVYLTGRGAAAPGGPWQGSLRQTAQEIEACGGSSVPVECDHADDEQVRALFGRIGREAGRLDVLVNNASSFGATPDGYPLDDVPFWKHPLALWDEMHRVGLRSSFVASALAAPVMLAQGSGLIVQVSSAGAAHYVFNAAYGAQKAAVDKMAADMAHDLRGSGVTVLSLWPPFTRTEKYEANAANVDLSSARSPAFTGRVVAALAADPGIASRAGKALRATDLAQEFGIPAR